jgi:hypothetical protein
VRTSHDGANALRDALREEGGTAATVLANAPGDGPQQHPRQLTEPGPAQIAATGPRTRGREREYELLLEMILEGYRLHYGEPVVVRPEDPDLALLLGDQLYALGLARLAELGDLDAVAELADVISLAAQAHTASDLDLAQAVWEAGAVSVGWGASHEHLEAQQRARRQRPGAGSALRAAAAARKAGHL